MHKPIKKAKKQKMVEEKKENIIENLVLQKTPKPFNAAECKLVDETISGEYGDLFPLGNKLIVGFKVPICLFFLMPRCIVYHPLSKKHKDEIKVQIMRYNSIEYVCPIFVLPINLDNLDEITREKPRSWVDIENSNFFLLGGQHIVMVMKVCFCNFIFF